MTGSLEQSGPVWGPGYFGQLRARSTLCVCLCWKEGAMRGGASGEGGKGAARANRGDRRLRSLTALTHLSPHLALPKLRSLATFT